MIYLSFDCSDYNLYPENEQPPKPLRLTAESTGNQKDDLVALLKPLFATDNGGRFDVTLKPHWWALFGTYQTELNSFLGFDDARCEVVQKFVDDKIKKEELNLIAHIRDKNNDENAGILTFKKDGTGEGTDYFDVLAKFCAKQKSELEQLGFSLCQTSDSEIVFKAANMLVIRPAFALGNQIDFS